MVFWCLVEKTLEIEYRHGIEVLYIWACLLARNITNSILI
jgi:hypothetical protein